MDVPETDPCIDGVEVYVPHGFAATFLHPRPSGKLISGVAPSPKAIRKVRFGATGEHLYEVVALEDNDTFLPGELAASWGLHDALLRLGRSEEAIGRPSLYELSRAELLREAKAVKLELRRYEAALRRHLMRMPRNNEKEPMRALYVYHTRLKSMATLAAQSKAGSRSCTTQGSSETVSAQLPEICAPGTSCGIDIVDQIASLEACIDDLLKEKGTLSAELRAFQQRFRREHHRKIHFRTDIDPVQNEYQRYKRVREELAAAESHVHRLKSSNPL